MKSNGLHFELLRHSTQTNILYAFVCDGEVKYVGKTIRTLSQRMYGYKKPGKTQTTNINNNQRILDTLLQDVAVEILALPDNGLLHYGQFHLNLAAALEDDIIRKMNPEWNGGIKEPQSGYLKITEILNLPTLPEATASFDLILQKTYFHSGFFNIGVAYESLFGADGEVVEIFLGDSLLPIAGTINRSANLNSTPRIMGGIALKEWFQKSTDLMGVVLVSVLSPTSIHLAVAKKSDDKR